MITDFHSAAAAAEAEQAFVNQFSKGQIPDEMDTAGLAPQTWKILDVLTETGLAESKGEAKRLIAQGGVKVDGEKVADARAEMVLATGNEVVLQVGKRRFLRVTGK